LVPKVNRTARPLGGSPFGPRRDGVGVDEDAPPEDFGLLARNRFGALAHVASRSEGSRGQEKKLRP